MVAPAYCGWFSTKSRSSRHSLNKPAPKPVRSTRFSQSLGMIWSVSTSDRSSGTAVPVITRIASMVSPSVLANWRHLTAESAVGCRQFGGLVLEIFGAGEVAGDGGGGGQGGRDEVGPAAAALAALEV